jgi:hypothetical protein
MQCSRMLKYSIITNHCCTKRIKDKDVTQICKNLNHLVLESELICPLNQKHILTLFCFLFSLCSRQHNSTMYGQGIKPYASASQGEEIPSTDPYMCTLRTAQKSQNKNMPPPCIEKISPHLIFPHFTKTSHPLHLRVNYMTELRVGSSV